MEINVEFILPSVFQIKDVKLLKEYNQESVLWPVPNWFGLLGKAGAADRQQQQQEEASGPCFNTADSTKAWLANAKGGSINKLMLRQISRIPHLLYVGSQ